MVGRHTGIVADLSSGSVLSVWEGREKELMNRPYIVESNHENKECEGPARGSPSGERYHLKKKKKKYQSSPRAGFEPGTRRPVVLLLTHYTTLPYNNKKWTVHQTRACKGSRGYRPAHYTPQSNKKWTEHRTRACKGPRGYRPTHYTTPQKKKPDAETTDRRGERDDT